MLRKTCTNLLLCALAALPLAGYAQQPAPATTVAVAQAAQPLRGALFKVTAHGHTMHLFGTMHVQDTDAYPTEPILMNAIDQAKLMYVEVAREPSLLRMAWAMFSFRHDPAYKALSPDMHQRLSKLLKRHQIPEAMAWRTAPFTLGGILQDRACPDNQEEGANAKKDVRTVDAYLADLARQRNIPVASIEDIDVSQGLLANMPLDVKVNAIENTVSELDQETPCGGDDAESLWNAWMNADQPALEAHIRKEQADQSPVGRYTYQMIGRKRDAQMASRLIAHLPRQDRIVVAVGVYHLLGEGSVIDRLQASGATAERIY